MNAITAYQINEAYAGLSNFAFGLNSLLACAKTDQLSAEITAAIKELDDSFVLDMRSNEMLTLYRGCAFQLNNPVFVGDVAHFSAYLSTSLCLSVAFQFAGTCQIEDGELHLLKIFYPKGAPHLVFRDNSEREVLLPKGCSFSIHNWELSIEEQLTLNLCQIKPQNIKKLSLTLTKR